MIGYLRARRIAKRRMLLYPEDAHRLPYMDGPYICFPYWCWTNRVAARIAIWIGETFNGGRYCFTVDRNKL